MSARPFNAFLQAEPALKPLLEQLGELNYLQGLVRELVPRAVAALAQVGSFREGTLVLTAKNGAAAAKLKQVLPELEEKLSQRLSQPIELKVNVGTIQWDESPPTSRKSKRTMSPVALDSMRKLAAELPASGLKQEVVTLLNRQDRRKIRDGD